MHPSDREVFAAAMTRLFAIYNDDMTDNLLEAWWGALDAHPLDAVMQAMSLHATDADRGRFRPVVADIVRHLTVTLPEQHRAAHAALLAARATAVAPIEHEMYLADTLLKLQHIDEEEHALRIGAGKAKIEEIEAQPRFAALKALTHG
jgi:hypothetical protein